MVERFAKTRRCDIASLLLYDLVLLPESPTDRGRFQALAELAVEAFPGNERILGAARCRTGQFKEAIESFEQSARCFPPRAWDFCFLAACHHRLGQKAEATTHLRRAADWITEADRNVAVGGATGTPRWFDWQERAEVHFLMREVTAEINR
jgi:hypothetical protein